MNDLTKLAKTLGIGLLVVVPLVACSSSTNGTSGGSSTNGGSSSGFKNCPSQSTCTQADSDAYLKCTSAKCGTQYSKCYGSGYASGDFSGGACQTYIACTQKCDCNDSTCTQKCGLPDQACISCFQEIAACVKSSGCEEPACATSDAGTTTPDSGNSSGGCAALALCCPKISDPDTRDGCQQIVDAGKESDCSSTNGAFKTAGLCN